jgi:hypothetical protein
MRNFALALGIVNVLAALSLPIFLQASNGAAKLHVISSYRELDASGAIDHERLKKITGDGARGEWYELPESWMYGFDRASRVWWVLSPLLLSSGVVLILGAKCLKRAGATP